MDAVPLASPYTWDDSDDQAARILSRKRHGAGFNYLEHKRTLSGQARRILRTLIPSPPAETQDTSHLQSSAFFTFGKVAHAVGDDDDEDEDDEETIVQLAQSGSVSLLLSIFKQIDTADTEVVSAKALIQSSCALTVNAACTPGWLDAREMVLAALFFLSSAKATLTSSGSSGGDDGRVLVLPLLEVDNPSEENLELRNYRKAAHHHHRSWTDLNLSELQLIFDSSPVARDKFVPPLDNCQDDEGPLLQKGIVPATSAPKRKGPAPGYRRKSSTAAAASAD